MYEISKTRVLPTYAGITADWRVNPKSGSSYDKIMMNDPELRGFLSKDEILGRHLEALSHYTHVFWFGNQYQGLQTFSSSANPKPAWNECRNLKTYLACLPFTCAFPTGKPDGYGQRWTYIYLTRLPWFSGAVPKVMEVGSFLDYDGASRRAWWSMQPKFEGQVSMLNFLFELKDFRSVAKAFTKLRSPRHIALQLRKIHSKLQSYLLNEVRYRGVRNNSIGTIRDAITLAAEARLANEFAIKPLIKDMMEILGQAGNIVSEVQAKFAAKGDESSVSHYSETNTLSDIVLRAAKPYSLHYYNGHLETETFTATMESSYKYKMRTDSDAFMRYWGIQGSWEAIWNAIPFSFVVDYFAQVGKAVKYMSVDPNVKLHMTRYCESVSRSYTSGYISNGDPRVNFAVNGKTKLPRGTLYTGYQGTSYERRICSPNKGAALPKLRLPNGNQGLNMAALATVFLR